MIIIIMEYRRERAVATFDMLDQNAHSSHLVLLGASPKPVCVNNCVAFVLMNMCPCAHACEPAHFVTLVHTDIQSDVDNV
jgi:hypothetical protein